MALAVASIAGSLAITTGLARRAVSVGARWSAGRPARLLLMVIAVVACASPVAIFWVAQGQFRGW